MTGVKLSDYIDGMRKATTAESLDDAIRAPYKHSYRGPTWSKICKTRIEVGYSIVDAHPNGKFVPRMNGRKLTVAGEIYGVGRGGNSTGIRYAWHSAGEFAKSVLRRNGFSARAAYMIWDNWSQYPHRCLEIVTEALAGAYPDPTMDTLIHSYTGSGPLNYTVEQNEADTVDKRATMKCRCGGTLFDWGCGFSEDFTFISWHCNKCADVFTEYVTPGRMQEIRQPTLSVRHA